MVRRAQIPVTFTALLTAPFARVVELTRAVVRWDLLLRRGEAQADRHQEEVIRAIRSALGGLREADDGALDEEGRYVRIADGSRQGPPGGLNCSGFVKWVVDGFYAPLSGGRSLGVEELKQRHLELRGNRWSQGYEQARDPYFGLDWARNLASALARVNGEASDGPESSDVRHLEFLEYREDVGYPVEELKLALFLAAAPGAGRLLPGLAEPRDSRAAGTARAPAALPPGGVLPLLHRGRGVPGGSLRPDPGELAGRPDPPLRRALRAPPAPLLRRAVVVTKASKPQITR